MSGAMLEIMPNMLLKKGESAFQQGDEPDGVYYVCSGSLKVTRENNQESQVLAELEDGDIFGELAMIDRLPRSATVTALEDSWLYKFSARSFEKRLNDMDQFMQSVFATLVLTVRNMNLKQEKLLERWGYPKPDEE
jgi:CRP-like cAMP-binding protein